MISEELSQNLSSVTETAPHPWLDTMQLSANDLSYPQTAGCYSNGVQYNIIFNTALQWLRQSIDTLNPRQHGGHFADSIWKCIFWNENVWIVIEISPKFVPKGPINLS